MYPTSDGISIAASIARITRTMITSTSVKPFFFLRFLVSYVISYNSLKCVIGTMQCAFVKYSMPYESAFVNERNCHFTIFSDKIFRRFIRKGCNRHYITFMPGNNCAPVPDFGSFYPMWQQPYLAISWSLSCTYPGRKSSHENTITFPIFSTSVFLSLPSRKSSRIC